MITKVRTARPAIILDGTDYYSRLAPYLMSLSYTDNSDGKKADDLNFELADRDGKFISSWMPKKGAFLDVSIIASRWFMPYGADISLDCGRFWIDSIDFTLPAHNVSVKATSIPTGVRIKAGTETRGWEKTSLKDIATQIAGESNMSVDWQADVNPRYGRTEQHGESPLAFLMKRCNDAKLAIKVHRNKLVVFDEQKLEEAEAKFSLLYGNNLLGGLGAGGLLGGLSGGGAGTSYRMASGHFSTKITDTTKKAKVKHIDPETGEVKSGEHTAPEDEDGGGDEGGGEGGTAGSSIEPDEIDQNVNEDTDSEETDGGVEVHPRADPGQITDYNSESASTGSTLKAKSIVRDKNKDKLTASVELSIGNPLVAAGQTFNLVGVGQFDGKWFIESVHHTVGPEYKTSLSIRRCLKGY